MTETPSSYDEVRQGGSPAGIDEALGQSETFLEFQEHLSRIAPINRPVLIVGERGTGKELAAARVHYLSTRWQGPLVTLNCSALAASLIESELFGHERGAFTGASQRRMGRFEAADGGTLFLDEIGNIPMEAQEKILRVVEYGSFERVGSTQSTDVDVRIVAATNIDLAGKAARGDFMRDLLDRLSFEVLYVPPLRERKEDIDMLAAHFAARMAYEIGRKEIPRFSESALTALRDYGWPGNIRELKNVVERAVYQSASSHISNIVFNPFQVTHGAGATIGPSKPAVEPPDGDSSPSVADLMDVPYRDAVWQFKVLRLKKSLREAEYNQRKASQILGITYHQFRGLYRKYREGDSR